jgi:hypothetical protein
MTTPSIGREEGSPRTALRALVDEYAWRLDRRDVDGVIELFVDDGEFSAVNRGASKPYFVARGREQLARVVAANDQFADTFHSVTNHLCYVQGSSAEGIAYCSAHHLLAEGDDAESLVMLIRYHDRYRLCPDGWRFASRQLRFAWVEYASCDTSNYPFRKGSADWLG